MKVLYGAFRYDPRDPDAGSGTDYQFCRAMEREGVEVRVVGPFPGPFPRHEQAVRRIYTRVTGKDYLPWDLSSLLKASRSLTREARSWNPDLVFSFATPFFRYRGSAPYVWSMDTTVWGKQGGWADYGRLPFRLLQYMEGRVIRRSALIFTFSEWCRQQAAHAYQVSPEKIDVFPIPAALPPHVVPAQVAVEEVKRLVGPLRLLLVGRAYERKGVDIAAAVVQQLNQEGIAAELTVCGTAGPPHPFVRYVGPFEKAKEDELQQYVGLYRDAHLLLHPARFEPAGIVPAEAAAFATPTLTNAAGGLATTVKDGVSGVVLPEGSAPQAYVEVIRALVHDPAGYYALCKQAKTRYAQELTWEAAGKHLVQGLQRVVQREG